MASFSVNFCRFFEDFISFSGVKWVWNWVKWIWVESRLRGSPAGAIKNNQNGFWKAKISKYFNFERIQKSPRRTQKAKRRHEFPKITISLMTHFCLSYTNFLTFQNESGPAQFWWNSRYLENIWEFMTKKMIERLLSICWARSQRKKLQQTIWRQQFAFQWPAGRFLIWGSGFLTQES